MLAQGGWPVVFRNLSAYIVCSGLCVTSFYALERRSPTTKAYPELC